MKSISLEKLRNTVGRRFSDLATFELSPVTDRRNSIGNPMIVVDTDTLSPLASRLRLLSLSHTEGSKQTKKTAKELIRQETSHIITKKLQNFLDELGLRPPFELKTVGLSSSKSVRSYLANSNDCIYLPPALSASFTYEDVENGGVSQDPGLNSPEYSQRNHLHRGSIDGLLSTNSSQSSTSLSATSSSANYLSTKIEESNPIPHVFAVVVELTKETSIRHVKIDFSSQAHILWPIGENQNRFHQKETWRLGSEEWHLTMEDADFYISTTNLNDTRTKKLTADDLAKRTRHYRLNDSKEQGEGLKRQNSGIGGNFGEESPVSGSSLAIQRAGLYVFVLPVVFPATIPASVASINGILAHKLSVKLKKSTDKVNRKTLFCANYTLPMARIPPSIADSIANKPIYVNRVWNDALHYVITFPKKYVSLGSEHVVNVKLVPLVKDVTIKRIKFNILERITYMSQDLSREYDYDAEDPFVVRPGGKNRERVVPVCELKTKYKSSYAGIEPFKEEVVKCPENNLLYACYEPGYNRPNDVLVALPLDINIALPFLTSRSDKEFLTSSTADDNSNLLSVSKSGPASRARSPLLRSRKASMTSEAGPGPSSPIIGTLETNISHLAGDHILGVRGTSVDPDDEFLKLDSSVLLAGMPYDDNSMREGYTTIEKALAPDSNFRHIQISHRLQVCFRISKPDSKDNGRVHHYEVVVDTPIVLMSSKCNDESIQLPLYDEIAIPPLMVPSEPPSGKPPNLFRMPTYEKKGLSIRALQPDADNDQLPSFEEAVSSSPTPVMRSLLLGENPISRAGSMVTLEAAPAYEAPAEGARYSTIRSALESSFARTDNSDQSTGCPTTDSNLRFLGELGDQALLTDQSLRQSDSAHLRGSSSAESISHHPSSTLTSESANDPATSSAALDREPATMNPASQVPYQDAAQSLLAISELSLDATTNTSTGTSVARSPAPAPEGLGVLVLPAISPRTFGIQEMAISDSIDDVDDLTEEIVPDNTNLQAQNLDLSRPYDGNELSGDVSLDQDVVASFQPLDLARNLLFDGTESIYTVDTAFSLRMPLLANASTDSVRPRQLHDLQLLTDTLSQAQSRDMVTDM